MKNKHCNWCDNTFESNISYQIYCSPTCREQATKEKIAQRYAMLRIKKRVGKKRVCKTCGTLLSIYNDDSYCNNCDPTNPDINKILKDIRGLANGKIKPDDKETE